MTDLISSRSGRQEEVQAVEEVLETAGMENQRRVK